jgi:hypothetical protein
MKMTFQEIRIIATGPCMANQLRDVNTICRRSWYIAAHVWKIYDYWAPLLADLFLYSYESEFLQKLVKDKKIHLISHTGILMTFYLSIILDLQNFFH